MKLSTKAQKKIQEVSGGWNWDNYKDEDTGKYYTVLQALYCKLSWVLEFLQGCEDDVEEHVGTVEDALAIVEALQDDIKI